MKAERLDHIHIYVKDLEKAVDSAMDSQESTEEAGFKLKEAEREV